MNYKHGPWTNSIAYTLSQSTNQFAEINNNEIFPAREDSRHQLKVSSTYNVKPFHVYANYVFGTGRPYFDLSKILSSKDRDEISVDEIISYLPHYHRIDLGIDYQFRIGKFKASIGASVFNLLDRENVKYVQYIYSVPTSSQIGADNEVFGTSTNQLSRTFSLNFTLGL